MQGILPFGQPAKRCSFCGVVKPLDDFHRARKRGDGRQTVCRECNIRQMIRYHAENPELCRARIKTRADRLKGINRTRVMEYLLEHPCVDCGMADPVTLEFDHLRDKWLNVSELSNRAIPWEVVAQEIGKCEVVCANCHRRRTCERLDSFRVRALRELRRQQGAEPGDR